MKSNNYQYLAARTINPALTRKEKEAHALFGMCAETGEIQGIYQKSYNGHKINEEHLKKEVGDLLWFIAEFCTAKGWTLNEVMKLNIEKLEARYPNGFESEKSLNRKDGDV